MDLVGSFVSMPSWVFAWRCFGGLAVDLETLLLDNPKRMYGTMSIDVQISM